MSIRDTGFEYDRQRVYLLPSETVIEPTDVAGNSADSESGEVQATPDELAVAALVQYINSVPESDGAEPNDVDIDRVRRRDDLVTRIIEKANFLIGDNEPTRQFRRISKSIATRNARELKQRQDQNARRRA